ncbi:hypothetical protein B0T21DRAFT_83042 [Apiosordaria backusii]|uniref:Uncharacterized protein n=1 Tax=Apiosordaria backusii TaxID=314023 RepID=A0AA40A437_9PEZI|nr:hypothetical protein B0T21DRAFT_83042 [Apiosordaria backusii]
MSFPRRPTENSQGAASYIQPEQPKTGRRDAVYFSTVIRHSSKIYEFFGISRSSVSSLSAVIRHSSKIYQFFGISRSSVPSPTRPTTVFMMSTAVPRETTGTENGTGTTTSTTMSGFLPIQTQSPPSTQSPLSTESSPGARSWQSPTSETASYPSSDVPVIRGKPPEAKPHQSKTSLVPKISRPVLHGMGVFNAETSKMHNINRSWKNFLQSVCPLW